MRDQRDDLALVVAARTGDQSAFNALFTAHRPRATAAALRVVGTRSLADDVVLLAFEHVFGAIQRGAGPERAFRPYLLRAVRNFALRTSHNERRRREVPLDGDDLIVDVASVEALLEAGDAAVWRAFATLTPRWQEALRRTVIDGATATELGRELDLTPNAAAVLCHRARRGLRRAYEPAIDVA